jgi:class 3 adenylate cyclase
MTVLFTDLKGSTELYERVGDLVAFDLVRKHFAALDAAVAKQGGSVVKTIGDAVMATFASPEAGLAAALAMREAMNELNRVTKPGELQVKIGLHDGPCLAVMLNERLDYFGQTVNIAARVQGLAEPQAILATKPVLSAEGSARLMESRRLRAAERRVNLKGIRGEMALFEIAG